MQYTTYIKICIGTASVIILILIQYNWRDMIDQMKLQYQIYELVFTQPMNMYLIKTSHVLRTIKQIMTYCETTLQAITGNDHRLIFKCENSTFIDSLVSNATQYNFGYYTLWFIWWSYIMLNSAIMIIVIKCL